MPKRKSKRIFLILLIILLISLLGLFWTKNKHEPVLFPFPIQYQFPYKNPVIPKNQSYRILIVGDSIVEWLGLNANVLRLNLIKYYPNSEFVTYNYGYSATGLLTLPDRLTKKTNNRKTENPPILDQDVDLIIIESFGYNPLSQYPLAEGLQKQNEILEESVRLILSRRPNTALAFMTPIAPDPINYARGTYDLSQEQRKSWVAERVSYIENHKRFAKEKGIPVIDVYSLSLNIDGSINRSYITDDNIHPSKKGIELMSQAIADYIFKNKVFPE